MATWTSKGLALPSRSDVKPVGGPGVVPQRRRPPRPWQFAPRFSQASTRSWTTSLTAVIKGKESVAQMLQKIQSTANDTLSK